MDATRAVLAFCDWRRNITCRGPLRPDGDGLDNYGYSLWSTVWAAPGDLNSDETPIEGLDAHFRPKTINVSRTVLESDYRVSVGPPKTHDEVMVTMSLKNYAVGSVVRKRSIHEGHRAINLNIYRLARVTAPHLAVIDGFVAMEGNGPAGGTAVDWGIALASTDALAADCLSARLMGFDPHEVGYLHYCLLGGLGEGEPEQISVLGNVAPEAVGRRFRPHTSIAQQREWRVPDAERYL